jgi:hypothetical protein
MVCGPRIRGNFCATGASWHRCRWCGQMRWRQQRHAARSICEPENPRGGRVVHHSITDDMVDTFQAQWAKKTVSFAALPTYANRQVCTAAEQKPTYLTMGTNGHIPPNCIYWRRQTTSLWECLDDGTCGSALRSDSWRLCLRGRMPEDVRSREMGLRAVERQQAEFCGCRR